MTWIPAEVPASGQIVQADSLNDRQLKCQQVTGFTSYRSRLAEDSMTTQQPGNYARLLGINDSDDIPCTRLRSGSLYKRLGSQPACRQTKGLTSWSIAREIETLMPHTMLASQPTHRPHMKARAGEMMSGSSQDVQSQEVCAGFSRHQSHAQDASATRSAGAQHHKV